MRPTYKVALIGDTGVGKTSITTRLVKGAFTFNTCTIGSSFVIYYSQSSEHPELIYHIWDTAGQERFRALVPMYLKDSGIIIMVYDVTDDASLYNIKNTWYTYVIETLSEQILDNSVFILVANKIDFDANNKNKNIEEGLAFARNLNITFAQTSAKTGQGISELFNDIIPDILHERIPRINMVDIKAPEVIKINDSNYNSSNYNSAKIWNLFKTCLII